MLAHAWDRDLGGRAFDDVLFDHFATEFDAKHSIDVRSSPKSSFRLRLAVEKLKKLLSSLPEAPINVEGLTPDVDGRSTLTRDALNEMAAPLLARFKAPMEAALAQAGLAAADISSVEAVGGASRSPAVADAVQAVFGQAPSRTLNAKECVSRGAALNCAMLSPVFRVREFEVVDAFPLGVEFAWAKADGGGRTSTVLFDKGGPVPCAKVLTFVRDEAFELSAAYTDDSPVPESVGRFIGRWSVGPPVVTPLRPEGVKAKLKARKGHGAGARDGWWAKGVGGFQTLQPQVVGGWVGNIKCRL